MRVDMSRARSGYTRVARGCLECVFGLLDVYGAPRSESESISFAVNTSIGPLAYLLATGGVSYIFSTCPRSGTRGLYAIAEVIRDL